MACPTLDHSECLHLPPREEEMCIVEEGSVSIEEVDLCTIQQGVLQRQFSPPLISISQKDREDGHVLGEKAVW